MTCFEAREHIAQGDLPGEHLVSCAECRRYADEIAHLGKSLSDLVVPAPPMAVPIPVVARRRSPLALLAAVLALLAIAVAVYQAFFAVEKPFVPEKGTRKQIMKSGKQDQAVEPPATTDNK